MLTFSGGRTQISETPFDSRREHPLSRHKRLTRTGSRRSRGSSMFSRRSSTGFRSRTNTFGSRRSTGQPISHPCAPPIRPPVYFRSHKRGNPCLCVSVTIIILVIVAAACLGIYFATRENDSQSENQNSESNTTQTEAETHEVMQHSTTKENRKNSSCCLWGWKWSILFTGILGTCYYMDWFPDSLKSLWDGKTPQERSELQKTIDKFVQDFNACTNDSCRTKVWNPRVNQGTQKALDCGKLPEKDHACWREALAFCKEIPNSSGMKEFRDGCREYVEAGVIVGEKERLVRKCKGNADQDCLNKGIQDYCNHSHRADCIRLMAD